jgi:formylglycine-generating enzyme required for sulfatase activity
MKTIKTLAFAALIAFSFQTHGQVKKFRLPDTGQTGSYTQTSGEDPDYLISPPSLTDNGDGTVTDNNTGLMWQKTDGGEMTVENATAYCTGLSLGGYNDWRLPTGLELMSINNYSRNKPALNTVYFPETLAEYWWTSEHQVDDPNKIWVVNAGGGIGAHLKTETISAGGTRKIHVRAVRTLVNNAITGPRFTDMGNGTIIDNLTRLTWQKIQSANTMTWEEALAYSGSLTLGGKSDWRLPNVKELQSLNDVSICKPSFTKAFFPNVSAGNYWSSTTLIGTQTKAWDINVDYGIVSYNDKTMKENVLLVRGGYDNPSLSITEANIPGAFWEMGDHNGHYDPSHPNDEIPLHNVRLDSFNISTTETTNEQFMTFLNAWFLAGNIQVTNNKVHRTVDTLTLYYTHEYASYYSISFDGSSFSMADFRADHPVNGVMWSGAACFCNWLSQENGLVPCYDLSNFTCNFTNSGYRLPTEAEWEWAARGGHTSPYMKFCNGNEVDVQQANLPNSGDPFETGNYPLTTPAGFYDGTLKNKADYNWPSAVQTYQTHDGKNGYGLYDMQGNVWEFVWDWYGSNYYAQSPVNNPTGPASGSIMPDGKPYRGMRGGNWYNGIDSNNVNDGHSRVSNRDPSYFRGPQDPYHPWYHVGFRTARKYSPTTGAGWNDNEVQRDILDLRAEPNPFRTTTSLNYYLPFSADVAFRIYDMTGHQVLEFKEGSRSAGWNRFTLDGSDLRPGVYYCQLNSGLHQKGIKLIITK